MTLDELEEQYAKLKERYTIRNQQYENGEISPEVWSNELDSYLIAFQLINRLMEEAVEQLKAIKNGTKIIH